MNCFDRFTSNTTAGSGNQNFFVNCKKGITTARVCYKIFCGGEYNYSFLFSNIIDGTFADGSISRSNMLINEWKIHEIKVGITDFCDEFSIKEPENFVSLEMIYDGNYIYTREAMLSAEAGEYVCLEISFSGDKVPCHEESLVPSFVLQDGEWIPSKLHPFPVMVGCDRKVKKRIGFFGDSITQGVGTDVNSYTHWCALVADSIGKDYSFWNLGLGYGRAQDAAKLGEWFYKASKNDVVVVCFGVNDIIRGFSESEIKDNLEKIVDELLSIDNKVIIQTIPPFDYEGEKIDVWNNLNNYIKNELSKKATAVFDCAKFLAKDDMEPYIARFGGHPDADGCKIWAENLNDVLKNHL